MRPADRAQLARQAALERIQRQVETGDLVIRQMTPEERERYGPPKDRPTKRRSRRSLAVPHHHEDVRKDT